MQLTDVRIIVARIAIANATQEKLIKVKYNNMKKYFNGEGTITGWQAIGRIFVAWIIYGVSVALFSALFVDAGWKSIILLPIIVLYVWLCLSTAKKRLQAYGFKGGFLNLIFPSLTDATYPNGKQSEE